MEAWIVSKSVAVFAAGEREMVLVFEADIWVNNEGKATSGMEWNVCLWATPGKQSSLQGCYAKR